jgi:hypothetical protein
MDTSDDAYRIATGQEPPGLWPIDALPPLLTSHGEYMSTEEVCGTLARAGVDEAQVGRFWSARLQPQRLDDPDKKIALAVVNGEQAWIVVARFGLGTPLAKASPLDEGGPDWRPRWMSVNGPYPVDQVEERARELTA